MSTKVLEYIYVATLVVLVLALVATAMQLHGGTS